MDSYKEKHQTRKQSETQAWLQDTMTKRTKRTKEKAVTPFSAPRALAELVPEPLVGISEKKEKRREREALMEQERRFISVS
jgi:hypothetical protein